MLRSNFLKSLLAAPLARLAAKLAKPAPPLEPKPFTGDGKVYVGGTGGRLHSNTTQAISMSWRVDK
jgi:hypothetical protein